MTAELPIPLASAAVPALFAAASAGTVGLIALAVGQAVFGRGDEQIVGRLKKITPKAHNRPKGGPARALCDFGRAVAGPFLPEDGAKILDLRGKLVKGGVYAPGAPHVYIGLRVALLLAGAALGLILGQVFGGTAVWLPVLGFVGYFGPTLWLRSKIKGHQKALDEGLPDALDLMVVCVEAGLTIDAAMQRVGDELGTAHPAMAREFGIAHMETRIGVPRAESLKNLGRRTGHAPLQSLAAILVQAERFGTSVSQALQVQALAIRQQRQFNAEENAAKNAVKLHFPLVLFIFPSVLIVFLGPMAVQWATKGLMPE